MLRILGTSLAAVAVIVGLLSATRPLSRRLPLIMRLMLSRSLRRSLLLGLLLHWLWRNRCRSLGQDVPLRNKIALMRRDRLLIARGCWCKRRGYAAYVRRVRVVIDRLIRINGRLRFLRTRSRAKLHIGLGQIDVLFDFRARRTAATRGV